MTSPLLLIHPGWQDSEEGHWQIELLKRHHAEAKKVEQKSREDWMNPKKEIWIGNLKRVIENTHSEIIFVGHSLACSLLAHLQKEYPELVAKLKGALLVSPADVEASGFPKEIEGFSPMPLEKLACQSIVVASSNDPYVDIARAEFFADQWGSEFFNIGAQGHINVASGHGEWLEVEEFLEKLGYKKDS